MCSADSLEAHSMAADGVAALPKVIFNIPEGWGKAVGGAGGGAAAAFRRSGARLCLYGYRDRFLCSRPRRTGPRGVVRFRDGRITYLPVGMLVFVSSLYSVGMWDSHFGAYKKLSMSPHTRYVPMKKTRYGRDEEG